MTKEHKHADLLRMAADNEEQCFECDEYEEGGYPIWCHILKVLQYPEYNWRPVKRTKKIKRWLWADKGGAVTEYMYSKQELEEELDNAYPIKLTWSETEFEVEE